MLIIGKKLQILFSRLVWFSKFIVSSPANIRLGQDVLKTSWRLLEDVFSVTFFCLLRCLEDILKTSWRHNCKTSCKHVLKTSWKTSWRRFRKTYCKYVFKTSWRRLEDVLENKKCLLGSLLLRYKKDMLCIWVHWHRFNY